MKKILLALLLYAIATCAFAQTGERYPLVPQPQSIQPKDGEFVLSKQTSIKADAALQPAANLLASCLEIKYKNAVNNNGNTIIFSTDNSIKEDEGYTLSITPGTITIKAKTLKGAFCAVSTTRQLAFSNNKRIACAEIADHPRFAYRGMHFDVSRHFFSKQFVEKFIDLLSYYKFNRFHFHLSDDQGWRVEIKKYPLLTEKGAFRIFNNQDSVCIKRSKEEPDMFIDPKFIVERDGKTMYGGYYTQNDIREIVAYAKARGVEIVPEIDMPGHMMAAINNYPFLSPTGNSVWGKDFSTPISPCKETTYEFAQNVYKEIMDLFPSEYIHLGADEVEKTVWKNSDVCQELMKKEGLKNVEELQSYFVRRMEKYFNDNGRKLIGWDEILEGGVTKTATVMYWRSWVKDAPHTAAKLGNNVIMTPGSHCYFDYKPDRNSVEHVYTFNPIPQGLNETEAANIIGVQANVWTEWIPNEQRFDHMVFPRMLSLAEVAWGTNNDFAGYSNRLKSQLKYLDAKKVNYRMADLEGFTEREIFTGKKTINVINPNENSVIRYTTDGSIPQAKSPVFPQPYVTENSGIVKLAAFLLNGRRGDIYTIAFDKQTYAKPVTTAGKPTYGLQCDYYEGNFKGTTYIAQSSFKKSFVTEGVSVPTEIANSPAFGLKYSGYINVHETGIYSFYLTADDGAVLKIADRLVIDNDGLHSAIEKSGQIALEKGFHKFELNFVEGGGGYTLKLIGGLTGSTPKEIDAISFIH